MLNAVRESMKFIGSWPIPSLPPEPDLEVLARSLLYVPEL